MEKDEAVTRLEALADQVRHYQRDAEAHLNQDDLMRTGLELIANGHPDPQRIAKIALSTADVDFYRWYD